MSERQRPNGSETAEQLRAEIDSGRTRDKVAASDPATVPLGTDEEAAGTGTRAKPAEPAGGGAPSGTGDATPTPSHHPDPIEGENPRFGMAPRLRSIPAPVIVGICAVLVAIAILLLIFSRQSPVVG